MITRLLVMTAILQLSLTELCGQISVDILRNSLLLSERIGTARENRGVQRSLPLFISVTVLALLLQGLKIVSVSAS